MPLSIRSCESKAVTAVVGWSSAPASAVALTIISTPAQGSSVSTSVAETVCKRTTSDVETRSVVPRQWGSAMRALTAGLVWRSCCEWCGADHADDGLRR